MKRQTWTALIELYYHADADGWQAVRQAVQEAHGATLLCECLVCTQARRTFALFAIQPTFRIIE